MSEDANSAFARMIGGVAGMMDSREARSLRKGEHGYTTNGGSTQYRDQVSHLLAQQMPMNPSPRITNVPQWTPTVTTNRQMNPPSNNNLDISKYIGVKPEPERVSKPQDSDLVTQLKTVLQPIYDQLEKLCVLTGLVYQSLNKVSPPAPHPDVITKKIPVEDAEIDELSIEDLEKQLDKQKLPDAEELLEDGEEEEELMEE